MMDRFNEYIEDKVRHVAVADLKREIIKMEARKALAQRIKRNVERTMGLSNWEIRRANLYDMNFEESRDKGEEARAHVNVIAGLRSTDPVYRKLSQIESFFLGPKEEYWDIAMVIRTKSNDTRLRMERREMGKEEYQYLRYTQIRNILANWAEELRDLYSPLKIA